MHKLSRREALRGTGVVALAAGAAVVVPLTAKADAATEEEAMRLWQEFMAAEESFIKVLRSNPTDEEEEEASDFASEARLGIARLSVTGPLAIAVKLATIATGERRDYMMQRADDARDLDLLDNCCLVGIYQHAVSQCGYDPLADFWNRYDNLRTSTGVRS